MSKDNRLLLKTVYITCTKPLKADVITETKLGLSIWQSTRKGIVHILNTVEPRYLELAYFESPLISKWKSGPCFNIKLWQQVTK